MTTVLILDTGHWDAAIEVGLDHLPRRGDTIRLREGWSDHGEKVTETDYRVLGVIHHLHLLESVEPRWKPEADRVAAKEEIVIEVEAV